MDVINRKHPCADCRQCQWCSEDRCRLCLKSVSGCRRKLSIPEQISLYEQLNTEQDFSCPALVKGSSQGQT